MSNATTMDDMIANHRKMVLACLLGVLKLERLGTMEAQDAIEARLPLHDTQARILDLYDDPLDTAIDLAKSFDPATSKLEWSRREQSYWDAYRPMSQAVHGALLRGKRMSVEEMLAAIPTHVPSRAVPPNASYP